MKIIFDTYFQVQIFGNMTYIGHNNRCFVFGIVGFFPFNLLLRNNTLDVGDV